MTRRRFIADTWTTSSATLLGDQAAHLASVLRAQPGQVYDVVAGGFVHRAEITHIKDGNESSSEGAEVRFTLHEELEAEVLLPLHLVLSVFKFDHFEWAVEKATELGVERITPVLARRTEKHLAQAAAKRAERWRRIALEASKQSRRTSVPEIADPAPLKSALAAETSLTRILLSEIEDSVPLSDALRRADSPDTAIAIGPEGGWTPEEVQMFSDHGWKPVTLGPRILRAETAAIAAVAITSAHLG